MPTIITPVGMGDSGVARNCETLRKERVQAGYTYTPIKKNKGIVAIFKDMFDKFDQTLDRLTV